MLRGLSLGSLILGNSHLASEVLLQDFGFQQFALGLAALGPELLRWPGKVLKPTDFEMEPQSEAGVFCARTCACYPSAVPIPEISYCSELLMQVALSVPLLKTQGRVRCAFGHVARSRITVP